MILCINVIPCGVRDLGSYRVTISFYDTVYKCDTMWCQRPGFIPVRYKCDTMWCQRPGFIPVRYKCDTTWCQRPGFIPVRYKCDTIWLQRPGFIYIYHVASETRIQPGNYRQTFGLAADFLYSIHAVS